MIGVDGAEAENHDNVRRARWNTVELLALSQMRMCPSLTQAAVEEMKHQSSVRRGLVAPRKPFDVHRDAMTYAAFLERVAIPIAAYVKALFGGRADMRKRLFSTEPAAGTGAGSEAALVQDWHILIHDGRHVDEHEFAERWLRAENESVLVPHELSVTQRNNHPNLLYHYNCDVLLTHFLAGFRRDYLFAGLEQGLYGAREVQVVLWYLGQTLSILHSTRRAAWKDTERLLVLQPPPKRGGHGGGGGKTRRHLLPNPPQPGPQLPPDFHLTVVQAQLYTCHGMIQLLEALKQFTIKLPCTNAANAASVSVDDEEEVRAVLVPEIDRDQVRTGPGFQAERCWLVFSLSLRRALTTICLLSRSPCPPVSHVVLPSLRRSPRQPLSRPFARQQLPRVHGFA